MPSTPWSLLHQNMLCTLQAFAHEHEAWHGHQHPVLYNNVQADEW